MPDTAAHDVHDPDLAHAKVYQLKAVSARVEAVEKVAKDHADFANSLAELLTDARIELAKVTTTIRLWGSIVLVGTPLLAAFGAWLVVRNTTPPPGAPPTSAARVTAPACELPEIQIAAKGKP